MPISNSKCYFVFWQNFCCLKKKQEKIPPIAQNFQKILYFNSRYIPSTQSIQHEIFRVTTQLSKFGIFFYFQALLQGPFTAHQRAAYQQDQWQVAVPTTYLFLPYAMGVKVLVFFYNISPVQRKQCQCLQTWPVPYID